MVPDFKKFAQEAKAKGVEVEAINMSMKVNESKENMAKFCPEGFPTVKFFKSGYCGSLPARQPLLCL